MTAGSKRAWRLGPIAWFAAGIAVVAIAAIVVIGALKPTPPPIASTPVPPPYAAPALLPEPVNPAGSGLVGLVDSGWLSRASAATGIPERALAAYVGAAIIKAQQLPGCGLGWNTVAAIGLVESDHGRHGGSRVTADGRVVPPIYGVALDGAATAHIPDSDGGAIDGDAEYDRAVGPMQLIPDTWRNWHVDGNGDGVEDPQNIDDAAVAAANYLCRASPDMVSEEGWRTGIGAYNRSLSYAVSVADAANAFATATARRG